MEVARLFVDADVYPRNGPTMEWDTAAAQCILEEAGGSVTDLEGNTIRYNKTRPAELWFCSQSALLSKRYSTPSTYAIGVVVSLA
jgi:3'-phosphoadenosine 5'-phosphosulfate (PAPS) 3'-phosphatase